MKSPNYIHSFTKLSLFIIIGVGFFLFFKFQGIYAADLCSEPGCDTGWKVAVGETKTINCCGVCRKVKVTNACAKDIFVPTRTSSEWAEFRSNKPSCVSLDDCISSPSAPSSVSCQTISSSQIDVFWDDVSNEDGYKIYRCTGSGCTPTTQVHTTGANVTSWSNTGLSSNTTYGYRVKAYNSAGDGSWSNTTYCTTQPTCNNECFPGQTDYRCSGDWVQKRECEYNSSTRCYEWSDWSNYENCASKPTDCGYGSCKDDEKPNWYCSNGSCEYSCSYDPSCQSGGVSGKITSCGRYPYPAEIGQTVKFGFCMEGESGTVYYYKYRICLQPNTSFSNCKKFHECTGKINSSGCVSNACSYIFSQRGDYCAKVYLFADSGYSQLLDSCCTCDRVVDTKAIRNEATGYSCNTICKNATGKSCVGICSRLDPMYCLNFPPDWSPNNKYWTHAGYSRCTTLNGNCSSPMDDEGSYRCNYYDTKWTWCICQL